MPSDRPSFANREGVFQVDIYQPVNALVVPFANGPYDLSNYECALIEAAIPRVMWNGNGIGLRYFYSGDPVGIRIAFQREWFSSINNLLDYLNNILVPENKLKPHAQFGFQREYITLGIKGSAHEQRGTRILFDVATRELFGFAENTYYGQGAAWVYYVAEELHLFYDEKMRFAVLTTDFLAPTTANNIIQNAPVLDIIPLRSDAAYGTFISQWVNNTPVYHRLLRTQLEEIRVTMRNPVTGQPIDYNVRQRDRPRALLRLRFRPINKQQ